MAVRERWDMEGSRGLDDNGAVGGDFALFVFAFDSDFLLPLYDCHDWCG